MMLWLSEHSLLQPSTQNPSFLLRPPQSQKHSCLHLSKNLLLHFLSSSKELLSSLLQATYFLSFFFRSIMIAKLQHRTRQHGRWYYRTKYCTKSRLLYKHNINHQPTNICSTVLQYNKDFESTVATENTVGLSWEVWGTLSDVSVWWCECTVMWCHLPDNCAASRLFRCHLSSLPAAVFVVCHCTPLHGSSHPPVSPAADGWACAGADRTRSECGELQDARQPQGWRCCYTSQHGGKQAHMAARCDVL